MIRAYLRIMQTRLGARLHGRSTVPEVLRTRRSPPGMLITLVENAIKHGIEPCPRGGRIDVTASRESQRDGRAASC